MFGDCVVLVTIVPLLLSLTILNWTSREIVVFDGAPDDVLLSEEDVFVAAFDGMFSDCIQGSAVAITLLDMFCCGSYW